MSISKNKILTDLQIQLFRLANQGKLLILENEFVELCECIYPSMDSRDLEEMALTYHIVQKTLRKFSDIKTVTYISLKLVMLSYQSLRWILLSLRNDEMTPSLKSIQSRAKESFALKIEQPLLHMI